MNDPEHELSIAGGFDEPDVVEGLQLTIEGPPKSTMVTPDE